MFCEGPVLPLFEELGLINYVLGHVHTMQYILIELISSKYLISMSLQVR